MQAAGFKSTRWAWLSHVRERHLTFSSDLCECLEFKHRLARLVDLHALDVMPQTYVLDTFSWSACLSDLANTYYRNGSSFVDKRDPLAWILKPALLNNGQHIRIFDRLSQLEAHFLSSEHLSGPHVLQRYIQAPDLLNGCKYSLRFFVVMTSEAGAFLYDKGYMNVALTPYLQEDYRELASHVTNEHLNDHEPNVVQIPTDKNADYARWYPQVKAMVSKVTRAAIASFPQAVNTPKERTFALFGFDFMLDDMQRVWLLEVNHGPCFPVEEDHPLQASLYQDFWEGVLEQFILPIAYGKPMNPKGSAGFESLQ